MFQVICIDGAKREYSTDDGKDIIEGNIYTVVDSWNGIYSGEPYYSLAGFECIRGFSGFRQDRFAPLSTISETTFEREYNKQKV